jgi:feruloyl esterase
VDRSGNYEVIAHDSSASADVRLFMMPGVEHCFGGPGPSWVNFPDEIDKWVETGNAPELVIANWLGEDMQPTGSRPVCAYPNVAHYDGKGNSRDGACFTCIGDQ